MCGRFGTINPTDQFAALIGLSQQHSNLQHSHNIAPGRFVLTVADDPVERSQLAMQSVYWGFTPSWADKPKLAQINARSETAHSKPFFRKAFHKRRCLIAADFWYEWQRDQDGKQPYVIRPANGQPFFFAGIWSLARNLPAEHVAANGRTAAILTTEADPAIAHIHPRMPIALTEQGAWNWVASGEDTGQLRDRLVEGQYRAYECWPVSRRVNKPAEDDAALIDPVASV